MRFKADLKNIRTFSKLVAALSSLEKIAWLRIDDDNVRFTVIPDTGSQVWALLPIEFIFDAVQLQSNEANNTINLELPLGPLQRALRSALRATSASLRLTKKNGVPLLSLTVTTTTLPPAAGAGPRDGAGPAGGGGPAPRFHRHAAPRPSAPPSVFGGGGDGGGGDDDDDDDDGVYVVEPLETHLQREREKIITQDIPVRVLNPANVETIMQPKVREPDVHIQLPPLLQLKAISDRFTKLAAAAARPAAGVLGSGTHGAGGAAAAPLAASAAAPKLELAANMHGGLRLALATDTLDVASRWEGLENPDLDPAQLHCPLAEHPSTAFRDAGPDAWAAVRVDGRDWSRVLSVGRLDGRVIACFADAHALILYVYVSPSDDTAGAEDCVITYYVSSYSL